MNRADERGRSRRVPAILGALLLLAACGVLMAALGRRPPGSVVVLDDASPALAGAGTGVERGTPASETPRASPPPAAAVVAGDDPAAAVELARAFEKSFAQVHVTLRYDEGEPPSSLADPDLGSLISQDRPLRMTGIVLTPDRVLVPDPQLHPRFVRSIKVIWEGQWIDARPFAWTADWSAEILALDRPLPGARELLFDADARGPYRSIYYGPRGQSWATWVGRTFDLVGLEANGRVRADAWAPAIVVGSAGGPVGITLSETVTLDGGWRGSPLSWPLVTTEDRARLVARLHTDAEATLLRVHLRLRSPKATAGSRRRYAWEHPTDPSEELTALDAVGVVVRPMSILVLAGLGPKATARLEAVEVFLPDGRVIPAKFVSSYRDWKALLVAPQRPLEDSVRLGATPIREQPGRFLLGALLEVLGERRVLHCSHYRISDLQEGWRQQVVPRLYGSAPHVFLFDREGALAALPIARRTDRRPRWDGDEEPEVLLPSEYVSAMLAEPGAIDPSNVPVPAEREGRLAWLGVETQPLDRDLARANGVSQETRDGKSGAIVSHVYAGSPAARAGLEAGMVLLRLVVDDRPTPIDVVGTNGDEDRGWDFPESLRGAAERFGDRLPHPWPSPESELNRKLTELGIGRRFTLEYAVEGQVRKARMTVAEAPVHFEAAPVFRSEALGVTVHDLTYEVRRYDQLDENTTGAIVSKVEPGSRAAVAGLRRFDTVLRINDRTVLGAAEFGRLVEDGGELLLTVKDHLRHRAVKIAATPK